MRTNAHLYDDSIHRTPAWNIPPEMKFKVGDQVRMPSGETGRISSALPAPPTSAMRCREHGYYVDGVVFFESELALVV